MSKEIKLFKCQCKDCWLRSICSVFGRYCPYNNCSLSSDPDSE